jgi:hypothetical protein
VTDSIRALGALRSWRSQKKLAADRRLETHFLRNAQKDTWIEDYVERETPGARKQVEDAGAAVQQEQEDLKHADIVGLTNRKPEMKLEESMVAIRDSLSDLASSDNVEDGEDDDDEETVQGKLSKDDEPGWVMGTITKTVQQHVERYHQKQLKIDELTQLRWEDAADYIGERDKKYSISKMRVPAVIHLQSDDDTVAPAPATFAELMEFVDIVLGISQMLQGTS